LLIVLPRLEEQAYEFLVALLGEGPGAGHDPGVTTVGHADDRRRVGVVEVEAARAFWKAAELHGGLQPVESTLFLKVGEQAFFCERVELMEPRAVRTGMGNRVGFRVARGVWVSTGTSTSESNEVWKRLDEGMLTIAKRRIGCDGQMGTRNLDLAKLVSASPRVDGIEVAVEKRQKSSGFTCANLLNPWIVANVCARVPDPANFDAKAIDVDFASIEKAI